MDKKVKPKPKKHKCCVIACESSQQELVNCPELYKLFFFPSNKEKRDQWRTLINKKAFDDDSKLFEPHAHTRVCSKHFQEGKRSSMPTLQLGYDHPLSDSAKSWVFDQGLLPPGVTQADVEGDKIQASSVSECVTPTHQSTYPPPHKRVTPKKLRQAVRLERRAVAAVRKKRLHMSDSQESSGASPKKLPRLDNMESFLPPAPAMETNIAATSTSTESEKSDIFGVGHQDFPRMTPQTERSFDGKTLDDLFTSVARLREEKVSLINQCEMQKGRHIRQLKKVQSVLSVLKKTKRATSVYTGLPNHDTFNSVFKLLKPHAEKIRYWKGNIVAERSCSQKTKNLAKSKSLLKKAKMIRTKAPLQDRTPKRSLIHAKTRRKLSLKEEFLMTLMRLRRGLSEEDLALRFNISTASVSMILITWIKFLAREFRCLVFMPSREQVKVNLPVAFRAKHPKVKHIIDCAETFIEHPSDPVLQYATWSQYKHWNTAKYFVCVTPDGLISFISKAYPGRITDKQITLCCGWLDLLEEYDEVLADRGFLIREELLERRVALRAPVGRRGIDQFSKMDLAQIRGVANTRIHVERAISRIKHFKMLSHEVNLKTVPQLDDILIIASAICNMCGPLIAEVEEDGS